MKTLRLALLGSLCLAACGGGDDDGSTIDAADTIDSAGTVDGAPDAPSGDAPPATCSVEATYTGAVQLPSGTFTANYDDNGGGAGDPLPGNDAQFVDGRLKAGPPADYIHLEFYEGYTTWTAKGGGVLDFGDVTLPYVIDIGTSPEDQDYGTCGNCISLFNDVTLDGGGVITDYVSQLVAQSGTITFTALPTAPGGTFTAQLDNLVMREIDDSGAVLGGGCSTTLDGVTITTTVPAGRTAPFRPRALRHLPRD